MKTNELTETALDWAVTKAMGYDHEVTSPNWGMHGWATKWEQGGPIIDLERIAIWFERYDDIDAGLPCWFAAKYGEREYPGSTPLIAAMRAYVAYKLGDEVEVPEELSA